MRTQPRESRPTRYEWAPSDPCWYSIGRQTDRAPPIAVAPRTGPSVTPGVRGGAHVPSWMGDGTECKDAALRTSTTLSGGVRCIASCAGGVIYGVTTESDGRSDDVQSPRDVCKLNVNFAP